MNRLEAVTLANQLLCDFDLENWTFKINTRAKTRLGCCKYYPKVIELSAWCLDGGVVPGKAEDTIRHEIAHAIAGMDAGHGPVWRKACMVTGANPNRCASQQVINEMPAAKFKLVCDKCHKKLGERHRRSDMNNRFHRNCGGDISFKLN